MPQLTKKTLGIRRPIFGSQPTPKNNNNVKGSHKKFKTPLLTKKAINDLIKDDNLSQDQKSVSQEVHKENRVNTVTSNSQNSNKSSGSAKSNLLRSNVSIRSMHLSFESITPEDMETHSDLSSHMNEPKVKEAYLQFVASLDKSSEISTRITSSPLNQSLQEGNTLLLEKSLEELDNLNLEQVNVKNEYKELVSDNVERKPKKRKEKKQQGVAKGSKDHKVQKKKGEVLKLSPDSSTSLSQEVLNRPEVKAAYLEFVKSYNDDEHSGKEKNILDGEESLDDSPVKMKTKKVMRIISDEDAEIMPPPKKIKAVKPKNKSKEKIKHVTSGFNKKIDSKEVKIKNKKEKLTNKNLKTLNKTYSSNSSVSSKNLSLYDKMVMIQESRNVGLYALCDICDKARYLPHVKDPLDLPDQWFCSMNPDEGHNRCTDPEEVEEEEDYLIHNLYNAGSIVWARMDGYPWWPAMVEDDPDTENYFWLEDDSMIPTWYHVTFFDSDEVTRAWMKPYQLKPYKINMNNPDLQISGKNKYGSRVKYAVNQAQDAIELPLIDRLRKYSFINRYKKPLKKNNMKEKKSKKTPKERKLSQNEIFGYKKPNSKKSKEDSKLYKSNESDVSLIFNDVNWMESQTMFNLFDE